MGDPSTPRVPQVRRIIFNDEEIGMGFNSDSGLAVGTALQSFSVQENPAATGQEVTASIMIVNSHEELQETLGMSFEAQGRYGFFSASAKASFSEKTNFNSTSTFLVASVVVENPLRRGRNFRVSDEAKALLDSLRFDEFKTAFGDSFVRGLQTGGEFYSVIRITSVSSTKQTELAATLQAEANGLLASGSFSASFAQANSESSTRSEFTATMYQKAGTGTQIAPTVSISEVIERFKAFPEIASRSAAAYETEVATYDTIPLPVPTPVEQEAFLFALADARQKKLRYIQTRNDLEFALRNPSFFEALPANDVLMSAIGAYTSLINGVMAHAVKLSRGQITPPQVFDAGALIPPVAEPEPVHLQRSASPVLPPSANAMPNFVGQRAQPVIDLLLCINMEGVDHCLNFLGDRVGGLGLDPRKLAEFFFVVLRSGVTFDLQGAIDRPDGRITAQFPSPGVPVDPLTAMTLVV